MNCLLIGHTGYIGREFVRQLNERQMRWTGIGRQNADLYDVNSLVDWIRKSGADHVINCAGFTGRPNVDACEQDKANCLAANAVLPGIIHAACQLQGVPMVHISSGCNFTGKHDDGSGFTEQDVPNFTFRQNHCSWYSGTKALGEEVLAGSDQVYILRLRIPFSAVDSDRNYLSKVMRYDCLLEAENSLSNLDEFVSASLDCLTMRLPYGIYHLTNPGSVMTSEVVSMILDRGIVSKSFRYFESESQFMDQAAKTPRSSCVLDCQKALDAGLRLTPVRHSIEQCLDRWIACST